MGAQAKATVAEATPAGLASLDTSALPLPAGKDLHRSAHLQLLATLQVREAWGVPVVTVSAQVSSSRATTRVLGGSGGGTTPAPSNARCVRRSCAPLQDHFALPEVQAVFLASALADDKEVRRSAPCLLRAAARPMGTLVMRVAACRSPVLCAQIATSAGCVPGKALQKSAPSVVSTCVKVFDLLLRHPDKEVRAATQGREFERAVEEPVRAGGASRPSALTP